MILKEIANDILELQRADLELRDQLIARGELGNGYNPEMERLHIENAEKLASIIKQIGFPTIDKVGEEANEAAWLVIQHSISLPAFMKKCAEYLKTAVNQGQSKLIHLAYLQDRIAVFEDRPQLYGTQFDWDENGEMSPQAYDEIEKVNERRKSIDLNTLEEQIKIMRQQAIEESESPSTNLAKRRIKYDEWRRKVGWI